MSDDISPAAVAACGKYVLEYAAFMRRMGVARVAINALESIAETMIEDSAAVARHIAKEAAKVTP